MHMIDVAIRTMTSVAATLLSTRSPCVYCFETSVSAVMGTGWRRPVDTAVEPHFLPEWRDAEWCHGRTSAGGLPVLAVYSVDSSARRNPVDARCPMMWDSHLYRWGRGPDLDMDQRVSVLSLSALLWRRLQQRMRLHQSQGSAGALAD
jgi:hypothetical protein